MSKLSHAVQWVRDNPFPDTPLHIRNMQLVLERAVSEDLDAIRTGDLEDPDRFVADFLYAFDDLVEVFVESVTKED